VVPVFAGRRGHPVALAWELVNAIRALPAGEGLNAYLRRHAAQTLEVPAATNSILFDLDTPEDYVRLLERFTCRHDRS
jgi:molybdenum cofactor cytidylyltransferase